jgi:pentose-5-phosphate-3-epimerase
MITNFDLARQFANFMDNNEYLEAGKMMAEDCQYLYQDKKIIGVSAILKTYTDNYESASQTLDEIQFTSEVEPISEGFTYRLKYLDRIRKGDSWFEHRCEQHIKFEDGKVKHITHVELPGEGEKLNRWRDEVGIKK